MVIFTAFYCREASNLDQLSKCESDLTKSSELRDKSQSLEKSYRTANREAVEDLYTFPSVRPPYQEKNKK